MSKLQIIYHGDDGVVTNVSFDVTDPIPGSLTPNEQQTFAAMPKAGETIADGRGVNAWFEAHLDVIKPAMSNLIGDRLYQGRHPQIST